MNADASHRQRVVDPQGRPIDIHVGEANGPTRLVFTPPIDIYETDEGLVLVADLPGVSLDRLDLQVQDNKLTLFGQVRPVVSATAEPRYLEYQVGDFLRSFILSDEVDYNRISATLTQGVLRVLLPKAPKAEARRIEVRPE